MDIGEDEIISIPVTCFEDAGTVDPLPGDGVPYALAVTVEVAPETPLPIYEEVRSRLQSSLRVEP